MTRYYDKIETPSTQRIFLESGVNRIPETDASVKSWFEPLPDGYRRAYNADGLPFNELIPLPSDSELLKNAKIKKKEEMLVKFDEVSIEPVTVNSVVYNGGFDSALKLDGAKRLVELAGLTEVTFYGVDNKPNVLSIVDANTVILTISSKYQTDFGHLQDLKVLIDSKLLISTVEAIVW